MRYRLNHFFELEKEIYQESFKYFLDDYCLLQKSKQKVE
jgi:hypothetical protein